MSAQDLEFHIERIDLAAMPAGGERRLRDAVARELAGAAPERLGRSAGNDRRGYERSIADRLGRATNAGALRARGR